jgi:hypothetical protein
MKLRARKPGGFLVKDCKTMEPLVPAPIRPGGFPRMNQRGEQ